MHRGHAVVAALIAFSAFAMAQGADAAAVAEL